MWFCLANGLLHRRTPWDLFQPPPWRTICLRVLAGGRQDSQCSSFEFKFRKPEQTAVVDGISGEITSRKKLKEGILRTSSSFQNLLDPGSTVAVSLPNIPQVQLSVPESQVRFVFIVPAPCPWGHPCRFERVPFQPSLHSRGDQVIDNFLMVRF